MMRIWHQVYGFQYLRFSQQSFLLLIGSPSEKHLLVPGSIQPGDILGESIYLEPSQNSFPTLIKPQKCLAIIIILAVVRHILLFSAKLRLENSRCHHNHSY